MNTRALPRLLPWFTKHKKSSVLRRSHTPAVQDLLESEERIPCQAGCGGLSEDHPVCAVDTVTLHFLEDVGHVLQKHRVSFESLHRRLARRQIVEDAQRVICEHLCQHWL